MRTTTKKIFCLCLSLILVLSAFTGCKKTDIDEAVETTSVVETTEITTSKTEEATASTEETEPSIEDIMPVEPAHVHEYTDVITEPTCTSKGFTTHTCKSCGDKVIDNYIEATGHIWGSWETTKEATEKTTGIAIRTCSSCGKTETRVLDKLPANHTHSYTSKVTVQSTCTKVGTKTFTCDCGDTYTEDIAKIAHSETTKVVAPTCTERGYTLHTCTKCGSSYMDNYKACVAHSYNNTVTKATCTSQGYTTHTCKTCGDSYVDNIVSAKGHSYTSKVTTQATCSKLGVKTYTCSSCGSTYTEDIPKTSHNYEISKTFAPSCTERGYTVYKCSNCGETKDADYVSATGHTYGAWIVIREATSSSTGLKSHSCTNCGKTETQTIDKLPASHTHSYVETGRENATCTKDGFVTKTCSCGDVKTEVLPATGHTWVRHHEDEVGHYDGGIECSCYGWRYSGSDYLAAFNAHIAKMEESDPYASLTHSYHNYETWVTDVPAKDWDECSVCGATK